MEKVKIGIISIEKGRKKMKKGRCNKKVRNGWNYFHCSRYATKDGYCWQHHPDEVAKRELDNSPWKKLSEAKEKIKELEEEIGILKSQLKICSYDPTKYELMLKIGKN